MIRMRSLGYNQSSICNFVGISRQAYYKRLKQHSYHQNLMNDLERVVLKNRELKSRAGLRAIYYKEQLSVRLGLNKFEKQMSIRGHALKPYRSFIKTTDSRGHHYKFDNLISGHEIQGENQLIVGDITYYQSKGDLYYIFHFVDYYTLEVKGLIGSDNMEGIHAERCLRQVFAYNNQRKYKHLLVLHTDGGGQYRSHKFQQMLRQAEIFPSHAKNCFENGLSERENGIVKNEYLVDYHIKSVSQLNRVLAKIKHQINEVWPASRLGYKTPKKYAVWVRSLNQAERPVKIVKEV